MSRPFLRPNPLPEPPPPTEGPLVRVIEGSGPLLFTAPHAAAHFRVDYWKGPDSGSGELAAELAARTGSPVVIATGPGEDPNWYDEVPFKAEAARLAAGRAIVDLHVMRDKWGFDVLVGTARGNPALGRLAVATLVEHGLTQVELRETSDQGFAADRAGTVTWWAQRVVGVPAIQLEIRWSLVGRQLDERLLAALVALRERAGALLGEAG